MGKREINLDVAELAFSFRTAKNKREQIGILADLNCCSPFTIATALDKAGALNGTGIKPGEFSNRYIPVSPAKSAAPKSKSRNPSGRPPVQFDHDKARAMIAEGVSTTDTALALNISRRALDNWMKRNGVEKPRKGELSMKKDTEKNELQITCARTEPCDPCAEPARKTCEGCAFASSAVVAQTAKDKNVPDKDVGKAAPRIKMVPRDELPAVSPTCCQPGKAVDVWKDYRVPMPGERDEKPEPEEDKPFTLGELRAFLTGFLPAVLNEAVLYIDGSPVTEFYGFSVTQPNGVATVDLLTRRG